MGMIKMVGFCAEHTPSYGVTGRIVQEGEGISVESMGKVLKYLKKGKYVYGLHLWLEDDQGNQIGGCEFLSDGEWVWPRYLLHYIEKERISFIEPEFIADIKERRYRRGWLSKKAKERARKELVYQMLNGVGAVATESELEAIDF